jgi:hypothetical protein
MTNPRRFTELSFSLAQQIVDEKVSNWTVCCTKAIGYPARSNKRGPAADVSLRPRTPQADHNFKLTSAENKVT